MKPIRVLNIVGAMNRGGAETWLLNVLRCIDRERFHLDFLVHTVRCAAYDGKIRSLGSRTIPCPRPRNTIGYVRRLRRILQENGPYDVVHSHVHHFSGVALRVAHAMGVPMRIAHSHSDTSWVQARAGWARRTYLRLMKQWIQRYATCGLAASEMAAIALWGRGWRMDPRWQVLHCGIDLSAFSAGVSSAGVRGEIGIPEDAYVLGHVGSINPVKNHRFLLEIAAKAMGLAGNIWLQLIGDGPLRAAVEEQSVGMGIRDRVIFAGLRDDVPRLLMGAVDVFLLPSLFEGLPLVAVEAQAAGLPVVVSDTVTPEVDVVPGLLTWLSLSQPASAWAEASLEARSKRHRIPQRVACMVLDRSSFSIQNCVARLESQYTDKDAEIVD